MTDAKPPLFALTLHRPWPWAICYANKRVENRTWKPPAKVIGQWVAIHAGATFDGTAAAYICSEIDRACGINSRDHATGIVALAKVTGFVESIDALPSEQRRWWIGPVGWVLSEVIVLETPVVVAGKQGLWKVEGEALEQCRAQFAARGAR